MERARHRRSKSATSIEGNFQVQKQKVVQNLVSDSRSYTEGISKEHSLKELSQNTKKRGNGTPIKKLLADEMAKEGEAKKRPPNVIARLMGLDGLPSPQHGQRQQKKLDKHQQRNGSRNIHQNDYIYEDPLSRRSSVDKKDFRDVYEDLEASHVTNRRYSSKWSMNSRLTEPEMEIIEQKFMDAKRLSCDEKFQVSKEFDDTLEMLDSNKDLLLRYLEEPNSLIFNPLHDLQVASSRSCYDRMTPLQASNSRAKSLKSERDNACKYNSSRPNREDGLLLQSYGCHSSYSSCNSSKNHLDDNDGVVVLKPNIGKTSNLDDNDGVLPTRIVVLKPNIGKTSNSIALAVSSPDLLHAHPSSYSKHLECKIGKSDKVASWKKRTSSSVVFSSGSKSREDRAIAREITRQMRENFGSFSGGLNSWTHTGARGYAGDESSYDAYESDSSSESGGKTASSRNSFDRNDWYRRSSSSPNESLLSKEATKRMSERWKMSRRCQDVETFGKGSTLGEMLAVPDRETRHDALDAAMTLNGDSENFSCRNNDSGCDSPLGISSRDGWKDGCLKGSSRSRSLPPSSLSSKSYRTSGQREALVGDLTINETINLRRSKGKKGSLSQEEDYSLGDRSSCGKPHTGHHASNGDINSSPDANANLIQSDISHDRLDKHEKDSLLPQVPATGGSCTTSTITEASDAKYENLTMSLDPSMDLQFKHSDNMRDGNNFPPCQDTTSYQGLSVSQSERASSSSQCNGPEPESSESSKEADHPSPVSVLEVSFPEDVSSSSDCFERVNAELHDLRMQLQLLKMESGGYADAPALALSNEHVSQKPVVVQEEGCLLGGQSWDSSYIDKVLCNSGLEEFDPNTFVATWHSPECPVDPWVFDKIEKNYSGEETTSVKFERKLLFDRINLALLEMFKCYVDPRRSVQPMTTARTLKGQKWGLKDGLKTFLNNQEIEVKGENPEKVLDREMFWSGFRNGVDIVGKEIEKMLIDDLIGEVLTV